MTRFMTVRLAMSDYGKKGWNGIGWHNDIAAPMFSEERMPLPL